MNYAVPSGGDYVLNESVNIDGLELSYPIMSAVSGVLHFLGPTANHLWAFNKDLDVIISVEVNTQGVILEPLCAEIVARYEINLSPRGRLTALTVTKDEVVGRIG